MVATEYGVASLRGLGLRQRIRALAAIAAPQHRDDLMAQARGQWGDL
jgi:acyl-CoA hydrolase